MATVQIRGSKESFSGNEEVAAYLGQQEILFESWGVDRLNGHLRESYALSPEEKQQILDLYDVEITDLKSRQGYLTQDVIVVSEATPNLDAILEKFKKEHHHTDDEVRFVVDGSGVFTIRKGNLILDVIVKAGDLLMVPAYTRHWFDLTEERKIKCIRIFKDPAGWVAVYDEPAALATK